MSSKTWTNLFLAASLPLFAILAVWPAYAYTILWSWFVEPFGAPPLPLWQAYGLMIIACSFKPPMPRDERTAIERTAEVLANILLKPLFLLAIGWLAIAVLA